VRLPPDSRALGCNSPGAPLTCPAAGERQWSLVEVAARLVAPLDFLTVSAFDLYYEERHRLLGADGSDFLLVNLFRARWGRRCRRRRSGAAGAALRAGRVGRGSPGMAGGVAP